MIERQKITRKDQLDSLQRLEKKDLQTVGQDLSAEWAFYMYVQQSRPITLYKVEAMSLE
jgi:hypothetical protein